LNKVWLFLSLFVEGAAVICCQPNWISPSFSQTVADTHRELPRQSLAKFQQTQRHMGSAITIVAYCESESIAIKSFDAAFSRIAQIESLFSDYQPDSYINRLVEKVQPGKPIRLDDDAWPLFERSHQIAQRTNGSFDYTLGRLTKLWRKTRKTGAFADPEELRQARESSGYRWVDLDEQRRTITIKHPKLQFDFGGIAKGYAADQALLELKEHGVSHALVNADGDIAVGDPPPVAKPNPTTPNGWRIAIHDRSGKATDSQYLLLANAGIASSGEEEQHVTIGDQVYSHILDPRTGRGVTGQRQATVVASNAADADAFASACNVLASKEIQALIAGQPGIQIQLIHDGTQFKTAGFPKSYRAESDQTP